MDSTKKKVITCTLQNWETMITKQGTKIIGNVFNHPTIPDTTLLVTGIVKINKEGSYARDKVTFYNLENERQGRLSIEEDEDTDEDDD